MNDLSVTDVRILPGDSGFLLDDGTTSVLYDSGFGFTGGAMAERIAAVLGSRPLDYIFLTHSHYDHVLGCTQILRRWPGATVAASEHTASVFRRPGALAVMADLDGRMARRCGMEPISLSGDSLRVDVTVKDGDVINAGNMTFVTVALPGHTKCSVGWYCPERQLLLGSETMGVYDGVNTIVPAFLVGYELTLDSIAGARSLGAKQILSPHLGLLDERQTEFYLSRAEDNIRNCARFVSGCLTDGMAEDDIIARFMERYVHGNALPPEAYHQDAARLNTSIMIKLIGKELLDR